MQLGNTCVSRGSSDLCAGAEQKTSHLQDRSVHNHCSDSYHFNFIIIIIIIVVYYAKRQHIKYTQTYRDTMNTNTQ